jgi:Xaa-Pro aminopeptidase
MQSAPVANRFDARQACLRSLLEARKLSVLVVADPTNIFYLTGFRGSAGVAIFGTSAARLWVDPRYTLQARNEAQGVQVSEERQRLLRVVGQWLRKRKPRRVGFEDSRLTCRELREVAEESRQAGRFEPAGGLIEELRAVKDPQEIATIRHAGQLTTEVLQEVLPAVRPGIAECDLAAEIEYRMRRKGAEGAAFETIVASGPRGALPHARASARRLAPGELVILDLGAILHGYAADMTRTVYLGKPPRHVKRLYGAVVEAQQAALEALRAGKRAGDVDAAARRVLGRRGLARYFTHSTGHGVGLEIHERPRLGRGEKTRLEIGNVVTAEPGVYIEGVGGIRVEDSVLVGMNGPEILTPAPKDNWFLV